MTGTEKEKPPYPKRRTCNCRKQGCGTEPEWEWEFEDIWVCLGCGLIIIGKTGKDAFASKDKGAKTKISKQVVKNFNKDRKKIVMSEELSTALAKVLNHLKANPRRARLNRELSVECAFKYIRVWNSWTILVLLPNGDAFEPVSSGGGRLPNFGRPVGNIIELIKQPNWKKRVRFVTGEFNYPMTISFGQKRTPCLCGRTDNLKQTVLGLRCNYCRGADVRHMNSVRQLGGIPRVGDDVLRSNSDYYRKANSDRCGV